MKVYATNIYFERFVAPLLELDEAYERGYANINRYANGEIYATVYDDVEHQDCLLIGTISAPDNQLLALLSLANALHRAGARSVAAFMPYLGYSRQDKFRPGESGGIAFIGSLLKAAGIGKVITIDAHSWLDTQLIGLPLVSLSPAPIFLPYLRHLGWADATFVAPDLGARARTRAIAESMHVSRLAYFEKHRADTVTHTSLEGDVSKRAVVVDDILDTGQTLLSACAALQARGVKEIALVITHGQFTGRAWLRLVGMGVGPVFVSDSCPEAGNVHALRGQIVPIAPLLHNVVTALTRKEIHYAPSN